MRPVTLKPTVSLLVLVCGMALSGAPKKTDNPYPNELQGFRLYAKFLAPLRPGVSSEDAVRQVLGDTTAVKRSGWTIQPYYTAIGGSVSNPTLGPLRELALIPDAIIPFAAVKFSPAFTHCHVGVSEINITFDVYEDRFGLEYWLDPRDSKLDRIVYGRRKPPLPPHTFC